MRFALLLLAGLVLALPAAAQSWPVKPIKLVVPYAPGGTADILARAIGQHLSEKLGQPVVNENRPGAGTAIGADAVAKAAPDGYTLLLGTVSSHAMNPAITKVDFDPIRDFTAIAGLASVPFILVVNPKVEAQSVQELLALAKQKPGTINYASAGNGTSNHLAGKLLETLAEVEMVHVPYRGSAPALADVVAGHVQMMFDLSATALPQMKAKAIRGLAIASKTRSNLIPELPTVAESGVPGFETTSWFGIFGPANLPAEVTKRLHAEINSALATADLRERLAAQGSEPLVFPSPGAFGDYVKAERERWGKVIKEAKVTTN